MGESSSEVRLYPGYTGELSSPGPGGVFIDAADQWILPGLIDLHLHGACGVDFNRAPVSEIKKAARFLAARCGLQLFFPQ